MPKPTRGRDGVYARKGMPGFWISYVDELGKRKQRYGGADGHLGARQARCSQNSIREAKQALASGQPLATEDTFATVSTRYIEYQRKQCRAGHLSAQELRRQTDIVEKNLLPFFGSTKLAAIRPAKINAYIEARTCEVAAKKRTS